MNNIQIYTLNHEYELYMSYGINMSVIFIVFINLLRNHRQIIYFIRASISNFRNFGFGLYHTGSDCALHYYIKSCDYIKGFERTEKSTASTKAWNM